jgi:hypothetical protein
MVRRTKAFIDMGVGLGNLIFKIPFIEDRLDKSPAGRWFMSFWTKFQMVYGMGSLAYAAGDFVRGMRAQANIVKAEGNLSAAEKLEIERVVLAAEKELGAIQSMSITERLNTLGLNNVKTLNPATIARLESLDDDLLRMLNADLGHATHGPGVKTLLNESVDDIAIWQGLKARPATFWDSYAQGLIPAARFDKWVATNFFVEQNYNNVIKQFGVGTQFGQGKQIVTFDIVWGGQRYTMKWTKTGNTIDYGNRSQLATILGSTQNIEAHHIIPWTLGSGHDVVRLAALDGFHLNLVENAIGLEKYTSLIGQGLHGNHPAYDAFVKFRLDNFQIANAGMLGATKANSFLQQTLIPELKNLITGAKGSGLNLNEYFKQVVNKVEGVPNYQ